jgi:hypothetical protein
VLVVWKLDRLGRFLKHLVELVGKLMERDVGLQSLNFGQSYVVLGQTAPAAVPTPTLIASSIRPSLSNYWLARRCKAET